MSALVFVDLETAGLSLDDHIWEFAAVRREPDGRESEHQLFIDHAGCGDLPEPFLSDHRARWPEGGGCTPGEAAAYIGPLFVDRPHVVGAVPNFDTERLARLLTTHGEKPGWHYHLIDVETLAVGYLASAARWCSDSLAVDYLAPGLPWDSNELSSAVGINPEEFERHTALGDVRWAMAIYDRVMGVGS